MTATPAKINSDDSAFKERPASSKTRAKAPAAPINAPPDTDNRPPPSPNTSTKTAPTPAPEEIPSTQGSANGLRVSDCRTVPARARPAPATAANSALGILNDQIIR
ncbi:hypothetical protein D3C72_1846840 [compost metagenome]